MNPPDEQPIKPQPESPPAASPPPIAIPPAAAPAVAPPIAAAPAAAPPAAAPPAAVPSPSIVAPVVSPPLDAEQAMRRLSRRSFAVAGGAAAAGFGGWLWLRLQSKDAGIPWFLRKALDFNGQLAHSFFKPSRLAPTFADHLAREPRANGQFGLDARFNPAGWKLNVEMPGGVGVRRFSLDEIKALPRAEMVTELMCIEGWSVVVQWAGVRLADFLAANRLGLRNAGGAPGPANLFDFVQLETPDRGYYVGLDMASALHPQTLLCYEMNGKPLLPQHGAPLRLVIPVKYGIKNIKRIGTIRFLDVRPADYWAKRGYDWYAGL